MKSGPMARFRSPRFLLGVALLAVLGWVGLKPFYALFIFMDRAPWVSFFESYPDRRVPSYPKLLREAAAVIPDGTSVAVVYPSLEWAEGYSYAYFRAQYFLPGRTVVPLGWPAGPQPERIADAEWAIVFRSPIPEGWTIVAESDAGSIARKVR